MAQTLVANRAFRELLRILDVGTVRDEHGKEAVRNPHHEMPDMGLVFPRFGRTERHHEGVGSRIVHRETDLEGMGDTATDGAFVGLARLREEKNEGDEWLTGRVRRHSRVLGGTRGQESPLRWRGEEPADEIEGEPDHRHHQCRHPPSAEAAADEARDKAPEEDRGEKGETPESRRHETNEPPVASARARARASRAVGSLPVITIACNFS